MNTSDQYRLLDLEQHIHNTQARLRSRNTWESEKPALRRSLKKARDEVKGLKKR